MAEQVHFLARVQSPDLGPSFVRMTTAGEAPGPDSTAIEINDPFADPRGPYAAAQDDGPELGLLSGLRLLPPTNPSKIIGVGRNFRAHADELGNAVPESPLLFFKPPSCLIASGDPIVLPRGYERIDMETELVVVIGERAKGVSADRAYDHVAGYTLGNDVSCRDLQESDKQWTRAKGFDGFGPCGPFVRLCPPGFEPALVTVRLQGFLDDVPQQDSTCDEMIFSIPALIEHISACMTLEPGDLIYTGTPAGVAPLSPGQVVRMVSHGLGLAPLVNPVV